ncbi:MAG: hypothetical protein LBB06_01620 [Endomicrobium sp.]|jgi:hypothetical protein|nr:hypothetical protein [Endomicrobium sp.]
MYLNCQGHEVNNINKPSTLSEHNSVVINTWVTYKKLRQISKFYEKEFMLSEKENFEDFKKDKYYKGLSKEQQKDINETYKAFLKSYQNYYKTEENLTYSKYYFFNRYYLDKMDENKHKIEQAKKVKNEFVNEVVSKIKKEFYIELYAILKEFYNTYKVFCDKKGISKDQYTNKTLEEDFIFIDQLLTVIKDLYL